MIKRRIMSLKELIANAALKGAGMKHQESFGRMCDDCAFKKGTEANNDEIAVQDAADCLAFTGTFNCHTGGLEDAGRPCSGFLYARQYTDSIHD
jgi:hypothetical protein